MNKCKDCDLKKENELLHENLCIAAGFDQIQGEYYTRLRVDLREWGERFDGSQFDEFYKILGEETIAEKNLREWREKQ